MRIEKPQPTPCKEKDEDGEAGFYFSTNFGAFTERRDGNLDNSAQLSRLGQASQLSRLGQARE